MTSKKVRRLSDLCNLDVDKVDVNLVNNLSTCPTYKSDKECEQYKRMYESKMIENSITIDTDRVETLKLLGDGSYGSVYSLRDRNIVLKKYKREFLWDKIREVGCIKALAKVPNFIRLLKVNKNGLFLKRAKSNISDYKVNSPDELRIILFQICNALHMAQNRGIFHLDVKSENILYDRINGEIRIVDFSLGSFITENLDDTNYGYKPTLSRPFENGYISHAEIYRPPEVYSGMKHGATPFNFDITKVDVWAVGILAIELILGYHIDYIERKIMIDSKLLKKILPDEYKSDNVLIQLLLSMLDYEPISRVSFLEVLKHPYFTYYYEIGKEGIEFPMTHIERIKKMDLFCVNNKVIAKHNDIIIQSPSPHPEGKSEQSGQSGQSGQSSEKSLDMEADKIQFHFMYSIIEWLTKVSIDFNFNFLTTSLAIKILFVYLSLVNKSILRTDLQRVASACLYIATSIHELHDTELLKDLASSLGERTVDSIADTCYDILDTLHGNICISTPFDFLNYYFDVLKINILHQPLCMYFLFICMPNLKLWRVGDGHLALCAIYAGLMTQNIPIPRKLVKLTLPIYNLKYISEFRNRAFTNTIIRYVGVSADTDLIFNYEQSSAESEGESILTLQPRNISRQISTSPTTPDTPTHSNLQLPPRPKLTRAKSGISNPNLPRIGQLARSSSESHPISVIRPMPKPIPRPRPRPRPMPRPRPISRPSRHRQSLETSSRVANAGAGADDADNYNNYNLPDLVKYTDMIESYYNDSSDSSDQSIDIDSSGAEESE